MTPRETDEETVLELILEITFFYYKLSESFSEQIILHFCTSLSAVRRLQIQLDVAKEKYNETLQNIKSDVSKTIDEIKAKHSDRIKVFKIS